MVTEKLILSQVWITFKMEKQASTQQPLPTAPGWSLPLALSAGEGTVPSRALLEQACFHYLHTFLGGYLCSGVPPAWGS